MPEHLTHRTGITAANIIVFAGYGVDGDQKVIGPNRVAYVGPGAQGVQIAGLDYGRNQAGLDHGDLFGKGGLGKNIPASRPCMGEHARGHDFHAVSFGIKAADQVGTDLGDGIEIPVTGACH